MRAVAIERYGGPEEMAVMDLPEPEPAEGEIVVTEPRDGPNAL